MNTEEKSFIGTVVKRPIRPLFNWEEFLKESKKEFNTLYEYQSKELYDRQKFDFIKVLGQGGFGSVLLSRIIKDEELCAVKVISKSKVVRAKAVRNSINEKRILQAINFPFCIDMKCAFQDNSFLYICLPLAPTDLFLLLQEKKRLEESEAKFYCAQILLALEYLHYIDIIYRDLKPENVLIDSNGYAKLTDFGLSKRTRRRTYSMCGTEQFLPPEIILNMGHGKAADWWNFGVLIYDLCSGRTPFQSKNPKLTIEKTIIAKYKVPDYFSCALSDLVQNILQVDLAKRYGNLKEGVKDIKDHPWFNTVNWIALLNAQVKPPYVPKFCPELLTQEPIDLPVSKRDDYPHIFDDF